VVAVFLGWLIAKEAISIQQIIGLIIIISGLIIVHISKEKNKTTHDTTAKKRNMALASND